MGRERDNLEDDGTWHQPLPGKGRCPAARPADGARREARGRRRGPGHARARAAPEVTNVERTSPAAGARAPRPRRPLRREDRRERSPPRNGTTSRTRGPGTSRWWGTGSARPYDQPTGRDAMPEDDDITPTPAPEITNVERTSPAADVSLAQRTPSGGDTSESDPHRTQPHSREGSAEWDALPAPVLRDRPGRLRQVPPDREDRRGRHGRGLARLARRPRGRTRARS